MIPKKMYEIVPIVLIGSICIWSCMSKKIIFNYKSCKPNSLTEKMMDTLKIRYLNQDKLFKDVCNLIRQDTFGCKGYRYNIDQNSPQFKNIIFKMSSEDLRYYWGEPDYIDFDSLNDTKFYYLYIVYSHSEWCSNLKNKKRNAISELLSNYPYSALKFYYNKDSALTTYRYIVAGG